MIRQISAAAAVNWAFARERRTLLYRKRSLAAEVRFYFVAWADMTLMILIQNYFTSYVNLVRGAGTFNHCVLSNIGQL